jgi:hypothetical protein
MTWLSAWFDEVVSDGGVESSMVLAARVLEPAHIPRPSAANHRSVPMADMCTIWQALRRAVSVSTSEIHMEQFKMCTS